LKEIGKVIKLFLHDKFAKQTIEVNSLICDKYGIKNDKFYKKDKNRSILLSSLDSYNIAKSNNIDINYGILGENILFNFNPHKLEIGTILYIGNHTEIEISKECTICNHLSSIDSDLPKLLKNDRGIFCFSLNNSVIHLNDKVYIK